MRLTSTRTLSAACLAAVLVLAGCDGSGGPVTGGPGTGDGDAVLQSLSLTPEGATVQAGATRQFTVQGRFSDGSTGAAEVTWSATGGTITSTGLYTAGAAAGAFRVVAAASGVADTATVTVTVPSANPTLVGVLVTPASTTMPAGGTVQFAAAGLLSNGATTAVNVTWTATGGTVAGSGLYTAGALTGTFRVVATGPGGLADTAAVTVTGSGGATPYATVQGDDWKGYGSDADLRRAGFWWFRAEDVHQYVHLAQDPVFGQVVRVTFQQSTDIGWAPELDRTFAQPLDRMWFRYRVRYQPGWTTVGPLPSGHANAYKQAFWLWEGYQGRGQIEISNTDEYVLGIGVNTNGTYLNYTERVLPGSTTFGRVTTEWTDNQWWEFVVYYEKTGATSARQHWWKRRLTNGGALASNPWTYVGIEATGATTPRVRAITLGANKNKSNPTTMNLFWGPWEVVDGTRYPNPWGMPNLP